MTALNPLHRQRPAVPALRLSAVPGPPPVRSQANWTRLFSFEGRPGGLVFAPDGAIWLTDSDAGTIWRVQPDGRASRVHRHRRRLDRAQRLECLAGPAGIAFAAHGSLIVADRSNHRVSRLDPDGKLSTLAGTASGFRDGPADQAQFRYPQDVAVASDGTIYVADTGNDRIRAISPNGVVSTLAGSGYDFGDSRGAHARFRRPQGVDANPAGGCYVADTGNNAVRKVSPDATVTTIAGSPPGGNSRLPGTAAGLRWPCSLTVTSGGQLWVAEFGNSILRALTPSGETTAIVKLPANDYPLAVAAGPNGSVAAVGTRVLGEHRGWLIALTP